MNAVAEVAEVIVDNSRRPERLSFDEDNPRVIVAVGGNTLSRGLTLEGLAVSFFVRPGGGLGGPRVTQMVADGGDDERRPLPRALAISGGRDRAGGDEVSLGDAGLLLVQVQFDVPVPAPFAEVEAVSVDVALPLLGHPPAVAAHDDARLVGRLRLQVRLGSLFFGLELLAFR